MHGRPQQLSRRPQAKGHSLPEHSWRGVQTRWRRCASGRRGSGAAGQATGHPGEQPLIPQVSRAEASTHGLHRPSLPAADGWVLPGVWFPAEGAVLVAGSTSCWVGCSGGPDPMLWTPGPLGDCPRASGPLCGLSAWPVTAQFIGYCPQRTASPWAHSACHFPFSEAALGAKLM